MRISILQTLKSAALFCTLLTLVGCEDFPMFRSQRDAQVAAPGADGASIAEQCSHLRDQIRANQESSREAPAMSTSPQIVDAAQGKADQRIQALRDQLDSMDCPDQTYNDPKKPRISPLPPAPNAPNP